MSAALNLDALDLQALGARPLALQNPPRELRPWERVDRELGRPALQATDAGVPLRHELLRALRAQGVFLALGDPGRAEPLCIAGPAWLEAQARAHEEALEDALLEEALGTAPPYWCPQHGRARARGCWVCGVGP